MKTTIRNLIEARRTDKDDEGGFTLIELLIVIVVLGILAAIVVFAVQNLTGSSATAACKSDAKSVEVGVEAYKAQTGAYPGAIGDLTTTPTVNGVAVGPWLRSLPSTARYTISTTGGVVNVAIPPAAAKAITDPTACNVP